MKKLLLVFAIASLANNINAVGQPGQPAQVEITNNTDKDIYIRELRMCLNLNPQ